jgi:predicted dehydrogenase
MPSPAVALVGCGAIAEEFYVPALQARPDLLGSLVLVDGDLERAESLRRRLGAAAAVSDHSEILERVQGAIVATPHHLHTPLTLDFVGRGVHVLCEKPLAESSNDVDRIVAAAAEHGVHVAVNQTRRLCPAFQEIRRLVQSGALGTIQEIEYVLGESFAWPAVSDSFFGTRARGRGVLFDTGAHIVDLVCWWLGGQPEVVSYADDSYGGTEAVARAQLRLDSANARIHLSWLSKLRNRYRLIGPEATVEGGVYDWSSFTLRRRGRAPRTVRMGKPQTFTDLATKLLANFTEVIAGRAAPLVPAGEVRPSIAVIESCYAHRSRIPEPWHEACERLSHV